MLETSAFQQPNAAAARDGSSRDTRPPLVLDAQIRQISSAVSPLSPGGASSTIATASAELPAGSDVVLELRVRNHPGTMSHITGLFARRGFNLDAILCVPLPGGAVSRMLLLVSDEPRLEQVERQLANLHDVLEISHRPELGRDYFDRMGGC